MGVFHSSFLDFAQHFMNTNLFFCWVYFLPQEKCQAMEISRWRLVRCMFGYWCCCFTIVYLFKRIIQNYWVIEVCEWVCKPYRYMCICIYIFLQCLSEAFAAIAEALATPESRYTQEPTCHGAQTTDILQAVCLLFSITLGPL